MGGHEALSAEGLNLEVGPIAARCGVADGGAYVCKDDRERAPVADADAEAADVSGIQTFGMPAEGQDLGRERAR
jgi:hypothetical protein